VADDRAPRGAPPENRSLAHGVTGIGLSLSHSADSLRELGPALDRFERLGIASAEIFLPALGVVVGGTVRRTAMGELRRICADRPFGLTLHGPLSGNLGDWRNATLHREVCRASLEVCSEIGASVLVQHATVVRAPDPDSIARALACEREALAALAPEAHAARVALCVETMFGRADEWAASPEELARQLAAIDNPWVGATIDFSHSLLNATVRGFDFVASLTALAPFARHLHIHDSYGRAPPFRPWSRGDAIMFGVGDLHLPPGAGGIPWEELAALPFRGPAVANLELDARWEHEWDEAIDWTRRWIDQTRTFAEFAPPRARIS